MSHVLVFAALVVLVTTVAWRPHGWGPTAGALAAVVLATAGGAVGAGDVRAALEAQWPAYVTLASVMSMTSAAERMGLLDRLAAWIEPRTRGPVRHAFRVTFVSSALVAAVLSNDAAILLLTPTVLALLRTVYPVRNEKFLVPFAVAVFAAAGVAPLVISNPMNLIFSEQVGISFNRHLVVMLPIAIAGWIVTYAALAWLFRAPLSDNAPALGEWPHAREPLRTGARVVLGAVLGLLVAYPILSYLGAPLWPIAAAGGMTCVGTSLVAGHAPRAIARGVTWTVFPFLTGVFVLAIALDRVGVAAWLEELYRSSSHPIATIGVTSSIGSALLNNHPMSVLNAFALEGVPGGAWNAFAALIGGDLGPRLFPVGSLAALIWYDLLRKHQVRVKVSTFVRTGIVLTIPTLTVSLLVLWALSLLQ